tara:strand:+ start:145 stop:387 length:243 start_codon:yes stop_codon:yes gene_type:complete
MSETGVFRVVVEKVIPKGRHGPYAVGRHDQVGSITFSLTGEVWAEDNNPEPGEIVYLSELREMQKGWRAYRAQRNAPIQQ